MPVSLFRIYMVVRCGSFSFFLYLFRGGAMVVIPRMLIYKLEIFRERRNAFSRQWQRRGHIDKIAECPLYVI